MPHAFSRMHERLPGSWRSRLENLRNPYALANPRYAFLMRRCIECTPSFDEKRPMDLIYLLFAGVLVAATYGFLMLCDRLGRG